MNEIVIILLLLLLPLPEMLRLILKYFSTSMVWEILGLNELDEFLEECSDESGPDESSNQLR